MFRNRSLNVKLVKDPVRNKETDVRDFDVEIHTARVYSAIAKNFISEVSSVVVSSTLTIIVTKTVCDIMKIGAKKLAK